MGNPRLQKPNFSSSPYLLVFSRIDFSDGAQAFAVRDLTRHRDHIVLNLIDGPLGSELSSKLASFGAALPYATLREARTYQKLPSQPIL
jgi:hypothetical protein